MDLLDAELEVDVVLLYVSLIGITTGFHENYVSSKTNFSRIRKNFDSVTQRQFSQI